MLVPDPSFDNITLAFVCDACGLPVRHLAGFASWSTDKPGEVFISHPQCGHGPGTTARATLREAIEDLATLDENDI